VSDPVRKAMKHAVARFDGSDGTFSAAGFGIALHQLAGLSGGMDGKLVRLLLLGRTDVEMLNGRAHFRMSA
jgi:hypothetical protein